METIVCPNCGANSTSRNRCDFCGSVLVRFADKNITDLEKKFGKGVTIIPGLDDALEENLRLQESAGYDSVVITNVFPIVPPTLKKKDDIFWAKKTSLCYDSYQIISSKDSYFGCTGQSKPVEEVGLTLRFPFALNSKQKITDVGYEMENFNRYANSDKLFSSYRYNEGVVYILDVGNDATSAARIVTRFLHSLELCGSIIDRHRDIYSFDVKTEVYNKKSITFDELGVISKGAKEQPKKGFFKSLFG